MFATDYQYLFPPIKGRFWCWRHGSSDRASAQQCEALSSNSSTAKTKKIKQGSVSSFELEFQKKPLWF
jgi:hypothetical protein